MLSKSFFSFVHYWRMLHTRIACRSENKTAKPLNLNSSTATEKKAKQIIFIVIMIILKELFILYIFLFRLFFLAVPSCVGCIKCNLRKIVHLRKMHFLEEEKIKSYMNVDGMDVLWYSTRACLCTENEIK